MWTLLHISLKGSRTRKKFSVISLWPGRKGCKESLSVCKKNQCFYKTRSSFPVIYNVGNVNIFSFLNFENKLDKVVTSYMNFKSIHHDRYEFTKRLMQLVGASNLFALEVVQKCQHCQLCVLQFYVIYQNTHNLLPPIIKGSYLQTDWFKNVHKILTF